MGDNKKRKVHLNERELQEGAGMLLEDDVERFVPNTDGEILPLTRQICKYFEAKGKCRHGDKCSFIHNAKPTPLCKNFKKGSCNQGESCKFSHDKSTLRNELIAQREKAKAGSGSSNTLLKKLLEKERRKESSLILQCVRFLLNEEKTESKHIGG